MFNWVFINLIITSDNPFDITLMYYVIYIVQDMDIMDGADSHSPDLNTRPTHRLIHVFWLLD